MTRLYKELARSYEKYGEDVRNGVAGRVVGSDAYRDKGFPGGRGENTFGLDSRGLKGKIIKGKYVPVPMQKRDHYLPKGYMTPDQRKARDEAEAAAVAIFLANGGKVNHV